jgi:hypothetical protein
MTDLNEALYQRTSRPGLGFNIWPQAPQEAQEYPMIMSLGPPAALIDNSMGPVDSTRYDPINKWRIIATCVVIKPQGSHQIGQK